jgi:hypothetical protein
MLYSKLARRAYCIRVPRQSIQIVLAIHTAFERILQQYIATVAVLESVVTATIPHHRSHHHPCYHHQNHPQSH